MSSALVLIKPDGMQKAIAGEVISRFLASDLKLTGMKLVQVSSTLAKAHYRLAHTTLQPTLTSADTAAITGTSYPPLSSPLK